MKTKFFLLMGIMFQSVVFMANSQPVTIKIWPEGAPGAIKNADYQEKTTVDPKSISRVEKISDPEMIVFLPPAAKATGTAVLICPGGGYGIVAIDHEGYAVAKWLNENGIAGIVLKYRLPSDKIMENKSIGPLQDAQEAMRIVRRNALQWKINPQKIGVMGFSAGGHLASTLSTHYNENVYKVADSASARPDFSILVYPVITFEASFTHMGSRNNLIGENPSVDQINHFSNEQQITSDTPPAFLVHSADDGAVPVLNSISYLQNLRNNKISAELHIYQSGGHGYGLAPNGGTQSGWPDACLKWLKVNGNL